MDRGVLDVFLLGKDMYEATGLSSLLRGTRQKSSDESPTDLEHRPEDRADQAYRVQLTARSISCGCLIFGGAHGQFSFSLAVPSQSFISSNVFLLQQ